MDPKNQQKNPSIKKTSIADEQRAIDNQVRLVQRAYETFPDDTSKKIFIEGRDDQVKKLLEEKGFTSPEDIIKARGIWAQYKDVPAEKPKQTQTTIPQKPIKPSPGIGATAAGIGVLTTAPISILRSKQNYDDFYKNLTKSSTKIAIYWEEQNDKYLKELEKNPSAKRPYGMAVTREEAVENHARQTLDTYTRINNKRVTGWANEHPEDNRLADSIDRIEVEKKDLTQDDFEKIRERYTKRAGQGDVESSGAEKVSEANKKMGLANNEINDRLVQLNEKKAREWARKKNDKGLYDAIERKRQANIARAKKRQGRISKLLRRDPTKKFKYFGHSEIPRTPKPPPIPNIHPPSIVPRSNAAITRRSLPTPGTRPSPALNHRGRGRAAGGIGKTGKSAAKKAGKKLAKKLVMMPQFWIGLAVVIIFLVFLSFFIWMYLEACNLARSFPFGTTIANAFGLDCDLYTEADFPWDPPPPGFTVLKIATNTNPDGSIGVDMPIQYEVTVTFDPIEALDANPDLDLGKLIFFDSPEFEHEEPSLISPGGHEPGGGAYGWNLLNIFSVNNPSTQIQVFKLTIKPTVSVGETILNIARIDKVGAGGSIFLGRDDGPSDDDCDGREYNYTSIKERLIRAFNQDNFNFGDPACSFTPSKLREVFGTELTQEEVSLGYADFYLGIARCLSPKISGPNYYSEGPPERYGLFRLEGSTPRFLDYNPLYDGLIRGDITWQNQAKAAVAHNNANGNDFSAWNTQASCLCGYEPWSEEEYCDRFDDIDQSTLRGRCTDTCRDAAQNP